jgi:hypothetical protein
MHKGSGGRFQVLAACFVWGEDKLIWEIVAGLSEQSKQTEESTKLWGFLIKWV